MPGCGVVVGDPNELLPASGGPQVSPNTGPVHPFGGRLSLHRQTHRANHTLLVLGGPEAEEQEIIDTKGILDATVAGSPMVDAVLGFCLKPSTADIGQMDPMVAEQLGITRLTVLAIRPDRYVGLRSDDGDPAIVVTYLQRLGGRDSSPPTVVRWSRRPLSRPFCVSRRRSSRTKTHRSS